MVTLTDPLVTDHAGSAQFKVRPGAVHELRLLLVASAGSGNPSSLTTAPLTLRFLDGSGREVGWPLAHGHEIPPQPDRIEILPLHDLGDEHEAAGTAVRYLLVPPDAASLVVAGWGDSARLLRSRLLESVVDWGTDQRPLRWQTKLDEQRELLIRRVYPQTAADVVRLACDTGRAQIEALAAHFQPGGSWRSAIKGLDGAWIAQYRRRLARQRTLGAVASVRVGFIGTERGFERLSALAECVWMRADDYSRQLAYLDLDVVVIEMAAGEGALGGGSGWRHAFSSPAGDLPEAGRALIEAVRGANLAVHLWATGGPGRVPEWRGAIEAADRLVAEGEASEWAGVPADHIAPRATEPAACSMAGGMVRHPDLMLVPTAADALGPSDFRALIDQLGIHDSLLADFADDSDICALPPDVDASKVRVFSRPNRMIQRYLLQAATAVLLPAASLCSVAQREQLAMDAIASGAVPILFGDGAGQSPLLSQLDRVHGVAELRRVLSLLRIDWWRDRRWRVLQRQVLRDHVWSAADRVAILGRDPFAPDHDRPLVTAVVVSDSPQRIDACLETFRQQTWPNKELALILRTGAAAQTLPQTRGNERILVMPA